MGTHLVPGLQIETEEQDDAIKIKMLLKKGTKLKNPVQMCFGMIPQNGIQHIIMDVKIEENTSIELISHCAFPNAISVRHIMDARIDIGKNASYKYFERHVHGEHGGIEVIPNAKVKLGEAARFYSEFELLKGRVGLIDIDYEVDCAAHSILEMTARINGKKEDVIKIKEVAHLNGEYARGVLTSRVAARDNARAEVYSKITASAPYARGHVDCKEIVKDNAIVSAVPIVEVSNPKAHITHEASLGSVDSKQLQTLMARGLDEDAATDLIIQGLLK
jgi:Fe-S cluster assembly scaffold protein SufB